MHTRSATHDDIDRILEMSREFYATTPYAGLVGMDDDTVCNLAAVLIDSGILIVVEDAGRVVGMVGLVVAPFLFNSAIRTAHEVVWYVEPDSNGRGAGKLLLDAIEPACLAMGCASINMAHLSTSPPQAAAIYARYGYMHCYTSFTKEL